MDLEKTLETAGKLRDAIATEVARARDERHLLRTLDAAGLFARASQRGEFLAEVARLERELATSLARASAALGLSEVTLERLRVRVPREGEALARVLSEVRALAGALREIDALNLKLAGRALACVRGYVQALQPTPLAYDRRGARATQSSLALVSSKA
jgi:hypothetical protein